MSLQVAAKMLLMMMIDLGGGASVMAGLNPESGAGSEASAEVRIQFGVAGAAGFEIEAEAVPEGAYQIKVGVFCADRWRRNGGWQNLRQVAL